MTKWQNERWAFSSNKLVKFKFLSISMGIEIATERRKMKKTMSKQTFHLFIVIFSGNQSVRSAHTQTYKYKQTLLHKDQCKSNLYHLIGMILFSLNWISEFFLLPFGCVTIKLLFPFAMCIANHILVCCKLVKFPDSAKTQI